MMAEFTIMKGYRLKQDDSYHGYRVLKFSIDFSFNAFARIKENIFSTILLLLTYSKRPQFFFLNNYCINKIFKLTYLGIIREFWRNKKKKNQKQLIVCGKTIVDFSFNM